MSNEPGWIFWINHNGAVRNFVVGAKDEDAAKLFIQTNYPDISSLNFISKQRAPANLVKFLKIADGKIIEWTMANPKEKMTAAGQDMDSPYDPYRK